MKEIGVYCKKVNWDEIDNSFDEKVAMLYTARKGKVLRLKNRKAAMVSIAAGLCLQEIIERELGIESKDLVIETNEYGKPYVIGHPEFCYNISHSEDRILIGFGNSPVGVDIECVKEKKADERVVKRCFTEWEKRYVTGDDRDDLQEPEEIKIWRFYEIWTMKEAYLKYTGTGINVPLNSFEVNPIGHTVTGEGVEHNVKNICMMDEKEGNSYIYSICVDNDCDIHIDMYDCDDAWEAHMTALKF